MRTANRFTDPRTGAIYDWAVNHNEEDEVGQESSIEHGANTAKTGLTRQQGDPKPLVMRYTGHILHRAQLVEMWRWWELSQKQTIYFEDFTGDRYEVIFTRFAPKRIRTLHNPRDFANAPYWYWQYAAEMEVIRVISGTMAGVGP